MSYWFEQAVARIDREAEEAARARQSVLTKPAGSLGELEHVAIRLAGMQRMVVPDVRSPWVTVFAGDHGVAAEGVSAFPQSVTAQMVGNFAAGGAAISVISCELGARLEVVDVGVALPLPRGAAGVIDARIAPGTRNFVEQEAMSEPTLWRAFDAGREAVQRAVDAGADLFVGGEMGIGNTTSATALVCALELTVPARVAGPGTGLDAKGVERKAAVIERALQRHRLGREPADPLRALRCIGGLEIAALAGAYLACAQAALPAVVDGFICSAAALAAVRLNPGVRGWLLYGHRSAEPGHRAVLEALGARPLLDIGMRLGEGSGAAAAVALIRLACALHARMATFAEARVDERSG